MDSLPVLSSAVDDQPIRKRLPPWLRREIPSGFGYHATAKLIDELGLETVCESAKCPNRSECWSSRTATFMVMGDVCTRPCGFCSVKKGRTQPLQDDEPQRVAACRPALKNHSDHKDQATRPDHAALLSTHLSRSSIQSLSHSMARRGTGRTAIG